MYFATNTKKPCNPNSGNVVREDIARRLGVAFGGTRRIHRAAAAA